MLPMEPKQPSVYWLVCTTAPAHRSMPPPTIATNVPQTLDVEVVKSPQVSLDGVLVHLLTNVGQLLFRQLPCPLVVHFLEPEGDTL